MVFAESRLSVAMVFKLVLIAVVCREYFSYEVPIKSLKSNLKFLLSQFSER
jgi:hypothetical protein